MMAQSQALTAIARAQQADPFWRPSRGVTAASVEGEIARNEAQAREADAHLMGLGRRAPEARPSSELLSPGGFVGWGAPGAGDEVRTVPFAQFRELLVEIGNGARPITTPATYEGLWYRRYDGSTIGVRFSREHGVTMETIGRNQDLPRNLKVHSK